MTPVSWRRAGRSLYARIAAVYLVLLLALSLISAAVAVHRFKLFAVELEQKLNHHVAASVAAQLEPALSQGPAAPILRRAAHHIHMINPSLDLHVLNANGRVLASSRRGAQVKERVSLAPIHKFLNHSAQLPIRGEDPLDPQSQEVFSVAPIGLPGGRNGYLYVILEGANYQDAAGMIENSYILRGLGLSLLITLVFTGVIGLVLFAFITRRFYRLTVTVEAFKAGDYSRRVRDRRDDEIGRLGKAFDDMAATIDAQVEALKETDHRRRRLVANLSHDLRTPLTSLMGYAQQLLNRDESLSPTSREHLQAILVDGRHLTHLVEQLATLSRLDARQAEPAPEAFSPGELAQDLIVKFQPRAQALGVTLGNGFGSGLPAVVADIGLVERALSNLIDNALKHTERGGGVKLKLTRQAGGVRFCVIDSGCGIPEDELNLVTQRFYRTRASRGNVGRGSGLGLAIVNEVMEAHKTRLELSSDSNGTRACFTLALAQPTEYTKPSAGRS